jgi:hypothetical protein
VEFSCLDSVDFLLVVFPILAAIMAGAAGNQLTVEHSIWQTDFGPMIVAEAADHWVARYPDYEGVVIGKVTPGMVDGLWIQPTSDRQCNEQAPLTNDSFIAQLPEMEIPLPAEHWGRFNAEISDAAFEGTWNYCAAASNAGRWQGTRLCSATFDWPAN